MTDLEDVNLFRKFRYTRLINEDTGRKCINILGTIDSQQAIIIAEKLAFDASPEALSNFHDASNFSSIRVLGQNDIYRWFTGSHDGRDHANRPETKFTLIYPATEAHLKKYSKQSLRMVTETPEVYRDLVKPFIDSKISNGSLNWVYNILEHKKEAERIVFEDTDKEEGFLLAPDLKWDQKTMASLYMLAIVHRRDIASIRDLKKSDVPWLKRLSAKITSAICTAYPGVEGDQLKLYVHYHPSYYHFHIHAVSISHDGGFGQTAGKAFLLGNVTSQLEAMRDDSSSFADVGLTYIVGEETELWQSVLAGLRGQ
ncbi:HIT-like domain-containing protein [Peziza echinospora]|nr:HIT-like domain-containing protein [Peziza echinospora]